MGSKMGFDREVLHLRTLRIWSTPANRGDGMLGPRRRRAASVAFVRAQSAEQTNLIV
jgi:hypothetical protein